MFFVLIFRLRLPRYLTNSKRYPRKKFLETLKLFFYFKLAEKREIFQISIGHVIWLEELTSFDLFFPRKDHAERTDSRFPKTFKGIFLCIR